MQLSALGAQAVPQSHRSSRGRSRLGTEVLLLHAMKNQTLLFWAGVLTATLAFLIKRQTGLRDNTEEREVEHRDIVDIASEDSFPASDPPAY